MTRPTTDGDTTYDSDGSVREDTALLLDVLANYATEQEYAEALPAVERLASRLAEQDAEIAALSLKVSRLHNGNDALPQQFFDLQDRLSEQEVELERERLRADSWDDEYQKLAQKHTGCHTALDIASDLAEWWEKAARFLAAKYDAPVEVMQEALGAMDPADAIAKFTTSTAHSDREGSAPG